MTLLLFSACGNLRAILVGGFHGLQFLARLDGDAEHPALAERIAIEKRRIGFERLVDLGDRAADRRVNVARGFHRLDDGDRFARLRLRADFWQLDKNDVGQFGLRVVGDANTGVRALEADPLVRRGVFQIVGNIHSG